MLYKKGKVDECIKIYELCSSACVNGTPNVDILVNVSESAIRFMWRYYRGANGKFSAWVIYLFQMAMMSGYSLRITRFNVMKSTPNRYYETRIVGYIHRSNVLSPLLRQAYELRNKKVAKRDVNLDFSFDDESRKDISGIGQ